MPIGLRQLHQAVGDAIGMVELHDLVVVQEGEDLAAQNLLRVGIRPEPVNSQPSARALALRRVSSGAPTMQKSRGSVGLALPNAGTELPLGLGWSAP